MIVINLVPSEDSKAPPEPKEHNITVPDVSHEEAQNASDLVEIIREKYNIEQDDLDLLYNCFLTVFVRGKLVAKN